MAGAQKKLAESLEVNLNEEKVMPCMCGDTNCPSCGPAQGHNPMFERVCDWMYDVLAGVGGEAIDGVWLSEAVADRLGKEPQWFVEAIERRVREYEAEQRDRKEGR